MLLGVAVVAAAVAFWIEVSVSPSLSPAAVGRLVGLVMFAGGCVAPGLGAHPTGLVWMDWLLSAALVAGLAYCGSRSEPLAAIGSAGLALATAVFVDRSPVVALALAVGAVVARAGGQRRGQSIAGAAAGAALGVYVLDVHWDRFVGLPSLVSIVVCAPLVVSTWEALDLSQRSVVRRAAAVTLGAGVLCATASGIAVLRARSALQDGLNEAQSGLDAARQSFDRKEAAAKFAAAGDHFEQGHRILSAPWSRAGRLVPIVGQHYRALENLSATGKDLATTGQAALDGLDLERLKPVDGRVDIAALNDARVVLAQSTRAIEQAIDTVRDVDSPWLLPVLENRRASLGTDLQEAYPSSVNLADGVGVAIRILGSESPQRYAIFMLSNAESRAAGGFPGSFAIVRTEKGTVSVERVGRTASELSAGPLALTTDPEFDNRFGFDRPYRIGSLFMTPDFPTTGALMAQALPQLGAGEVDGVITVDPFALKVLLEVTGPVRVSEWPTEINADNVIQTLLFDQYVKLDRARGEFQGEMAKVILDRLLDGALPRPDRFIAELSPIMRGRHLQFYSRAPDVQRFFRQAKVAGAVPPADGDSFQLITQNLIGNKIDWFLQRELSYRVVYDPNAGEAKITATIKLTNKAPTSGLPDVVIGSPEGARTVPGLNRLWLNVLTTNELVRATIDGQPLTLLPGFEHEHAALSAEVLVASGQTRTVVVELRRQLQPGSPYQLHLLRQPVAQPDAVDLRLELADGWRWTEGSEVIERREGRFEAPLDVAATPKRSG